MSGAVASHRVAFDGSRLPPGQGAVGLIDVGDQLFDDYTLDRPFAVRRVVVKAVAHAIYQDRDHGGLFSAADIRVQQRCKFPTGALIAAEAMQPVDHWIAVVFGRLVIGRQVNQVTDFASGEAAYEGAVDSPWGRGAVGVQPACRRAGGLRRTDAGS